MAKKKAAKKNGGKFGMITSIITLVLSVLCFVFLATPVVKTVTTLTVFGSTTTKVEQKTGYEYTDYYFEKVDAKNENGEKVQITRLEKQHREVKELQDKIKNSSLSEEKKKEIQNEIKAESAPIRICDTIIAVEVIAAIALVASFVALILFAVKKNGAAGALNIVAILGMLAVFISACIMQAEVNNYFKFEYSADDLLNIKTSSIAPALVLTVSLIGTLVGGIFTVLDKKK